MKITVKWLTEKNACDEGNTMNTTIEVVKFVEDTRKQIAKLRQEAFTSGFLLGLASGCVIAAYIMFFTLDAG